MRTMLVMCCLLAGCATQAAAPPVPQVATKVIDKGCEWTKPISVAPTDDIRTKRQVLAHDLAYAQNCPEQQKKYQSGGTTAAK